MVLQVEATDIFPPRFFLGGVLFYFLLLVLHLAVVSVTTGGMSRYQDPVRFAVSQHSQETGSYSWTTGQGGRRSLSQQQDWYLFVHSKRNRTSPAK